MHNRSFEKINAVSAEQKKKCSNGAGFRGFRARHFPGRRRNLVSWGTVSKNSIMRGFVDVYYVDYVLPGFRAMTVPPFGIYIRKDCAHDEVLLYHELVHWQQYLEMGLIKFYANYFGGLLQYGYWNSPMEYEARLSSYLQFSSYQE